MPWVMRLSEAACWPGGVEGPVESLPFEREAAMRRGEDGLRWWVAGWLVSVDGWSKVVAPGHMGSARGGWRWGGFFGKLLMGWEIKNLPWLWTGLSLLAN